MDKKEIQWKRLKSFFDLLNKSIWERFKVLPLISSLSAMLLIIATFNKELIPLTFFVRWLIVILLSLIPISLFGYLVELRNAENHALRRIDEITEGELKEEIKKRTEGKFIAYLPWLVSAVLTIIIFLLALLVLKVPVISILNNLWKSLY